MGFLLVITRPQLYWICQLCGWGTYGMVLYAVNVLRQQQSSTEPVQALPYLLIVVLGMLLTHLFRAWARQQRWSTRPLGFQLLIVVLSAGVLSLLHTAIYFAISVGMLGWSLPDNGLNLLINQLNLVAVFLLWLFIYFGYKYFSNYKQEEIARLKQQAMRQQMELHALRSQINPHFIFNALNGIRALVVENPAQAQTAVTGLARMLRKVLSAEQDTFLPLSEELALVSDYLALEGIRYEERLQTRIDVSPGCEDIPVPSLALLTLVENAIKHGIARQVSRGLVHVQAEMRNEQLCVQVTNPGELSATEGEAGYGLRNIRERLRLLYGYHATLRLEQLAGKRVQATICFPLQPPISEDGISP